MNVRVIIALLVAKLTRSLLRITGRGGTALPGRVALKLCPELLRYLAKDVNTILVTGTNGKTTSCRIVEQLLKEAELPCFANRGGANLAQGITTEFAMNTTITGKPKFPWAVIECDEAAAKSVCRSVRPKAILVTNVFSDQLDRFGDVSNTLESIRAGLKNAPEAILCLNADCSLSATLADELPNKVIWYGVETEIYRQRVDEVSDAPRCSICGSEYVYAWQTYGHLGGFRCSKCGFSRPAADVAVTQILEQTTDSTKVMIRLENKEFPAVISVPGGFNVYNTAGVAAVGLGLGIRTQAILRAPEMFHCGFGRMEKIDMDGVSGRMILIKNPAGCNQTLNFLTNLDGNALFVICLNDYPGDGTDISWIWDADFERLNTLGDRLTGVYCAGTRAAEMALRLKYAGIPVDKLQIFNDYDRMIDSICQQKEPVIMMPTYSAMLAFREKLGQRFHLKDFWE